MENCPPPGIPGLGSLDWKPTDEQLDYSKLLKIKLLKFYIPIFKVLQELLKYFTSLKMCKCSQILHPLPRVALHKEQTDKLVH